MTTSANVVQTSVTNTANNQSLNYALPNDQDTGSKFCSVKEKKPDSIGTLNSTKRFQPAFFSCISQGVADHCHYQGAIRGLKDSYVVLNTCSGLRYRFFPFNYITI